MTHRQPARPTTSRIRSLHVAGLLVAVAAIAAVIGDQVLRSPIPTASSPPTATPSIHRLRGERRAARSVADGAVPDDTTVFDDQVPGVAKLHPALRGALRQAATDAAASDVEFIIDSGWRSREYQEQLLRDAISKYGSQAEAARWVAPPNKSAHVKGDAVDLGPAAASWLSEHGATYGLCRIYANEPWHFELRPNAVGHGCPAMYADPTHDPRLQPSRNAP